MKRFLSILIPVTILLLILFVAQPAAAQCPMCKSAIESAIQNGDNTAIGINKGILYLLLMPYILYATIFVAWYWSNRKKVVTH